MAIINPFHRSDNLAARQQLVVALGCGVPARHPVVQIRQFDAEDGGLQAHRAGRPQPSSTCSYFPTRP